MQKEYGRTSHVKLSPREKEVVTYLANGKSRDQIAEILSIKAVTVRAYLESTREKLNAENILHAATLAVAKGFIDLIEDAPLKIDSSRTENTKDRKNLVLGRSLGRKKQSQKQKTK
jgi:DNA-binding CsgD family transcriptional regulator